MDKTWEYTPTTEDWAAHYARLRRLKATRRGHITKIGSQLCQSCYKPLYRVQYEKCTSKVGY